jgi:TetR/AcrR family transcriptional regulator, cholesterol catabolism regulator
MQPPFRLAVKPIAGPPGAGGFAIIIFRVRNQKLRGTNTARGPGTVKRAGVLECAAELFAQRGYRAASLELVADRLGVTRQALYHHFHCKAEILGALFDEHMTKLEAEAREVLPGPANGSGEQFERLVCGHLAVALENPDPVVVLTQEQPELLRLDWLHAGARHREYVQLFVDAFERGAGQGRLHPMDPWIAANTIMAAVNGVCVSRQNDGLTSPDVAEVLPEVVADGILERFVSPVRPCRFGAVNFAAAES